MWCLHLHRSPLSCMLCSIVPELTVRASTDPLLKTVIQKQQILYNKSFGSIKKTESSLSPPLKLAYTAISNHLKLCSMVLLYVPCLTFAASLVLFPPIPQQELIPSFKHFNQMDVITPTFLNFQRQK